MHSREISINEWEALAFFGSEPVSRAYGDCWWDSDVVYKVTDANGLALTCAIHPIHHDARLTLSFGDHLVYDWSAMNLDDIRCIEEKDRTVMMFVVNTQESLELQVAPKILISIPPLLHRRCCTCPAQGQPAKQAPPWVTCNIRRTLEAFNKKAASPSLRIRREGWFVERFQRSKCLAPPKVAFASRADLGLGNV